jgi:hypothetical protein
VSDFVIWEPGETVTCVLCERERGGDDPPGNWFRHRPSHRRRVPIFGPFGSVLGHLEYVDP